MSPIWSLDVTAASTSLAASSTDSDYTVPNLADRTQSSERHIWRLIDAGLVPGVYRLGRLVRIHRATADAWLAGGCRPIRQMARG
jgi:excisionase family DNA binding protein